jgi:hypothetical protein
MCDPFLLQHGAYVPEALVEHACVSEPAIVESGSSGDEAMVEPGWIAPRTGALLRGAKARESLGPQSTRAGYQRVEIFAMETR